MGFGTRGWGRILGRGVRVGFRDVGQGHVSEHWSSTNFETRVGFEFRYQGRGRGRVLRQGSGLGSGSGFEMEVGVGF